jgi:nitrogen fixation protein NifX
MKVAFATSTGIAVDENFRKTSCFTIWDVGPREAFFVSQVSIQQDPGSEEGRIAARANALAHCTIVCSREMNGPSAAKLIARGIHPMKTGATTAVEEVIGRLQKVLQENPPPWIRKAELQEFQDLPDFPESP